MRKLLRSDTSIKVISVLISILLWMYVVGVNNPTVSVVVKGIPVKVTNNKSFDLSGLKVISGMEQTIDVRIEGRHSEVSKVSASDIKATFDISGVKKAGKYELDVVLNLPESGVKYTNITSDKVKIFADFVVAVNKDVTVITKGEPKEGFTVESVTPADAKTLVRGPKSVVDTVEKVVAVVDVSGADSDISKNYTLKVTDNAGRETDMTYVTTNITETLVNVKLTQAKEVEVNPVFTSPELLSGYDVKFSPEKVKVTGGASIMKSLAIINTEQIEITDDILPEEGQSKTIKTRLKLPDGVLLTGESANIEVILTSKAH